MPGCVIGWGGGSAIDAAKTAAALMRQEGSVADYFYGRRKIGGKGCFFAALPTTAGTGAEITPNAVLTDPDTGIKQSIRHDTMFADIAIVDPELTWDCPPGVTAASGFDALTQGIESYLSKKANVASEALALKAAADVFTMLLPAVRESVLPARTMVAEGSMLAAMAFAQSGSAPCTASAIRSAACCTCRTASAARSCCRRCCAGICRPAGRRWKCWLECWCRTPPRR